MQPSAHRRRDPAATREWLRLGVFLALLLVGLGVLRWQAWRAEEATAASQLEAQARAVEENLSRQFEGAAAALRALRDEIGTAGVMPQGAALQTLAAAMPGVSTLMVLDREGRTILSNRPERLGQSFAGHEDFLRARDRADPAALHLSPPFQSATGVFSVNLSVSIPGADGRFAGVVAATLDPAYFGGALRAALYAPDMWGAIAHGEGVLMIQVPSRPGLEGTRLDRPGSLFERHRASGQRATVFVGTVVATGEHRMIVHRTIRPEGLGLDQALVLGLTRDTAAIHAPWWQATASHAVLMLALTAISALGLAALQRRRAAAEATQREAAARAASDAERLTLALEGAALALWDLDLGTGVCTVNARWFEMLGLPPDATDQTGTEAWLSRVHPEDRDRVAALQQAHVDGASDRFLATYRLRHADGRWLWVQDRGRVIERDAAGRARRLVGTHLDVTDQVRAQEAVQRSERDLAITLHSIGDAVVATDAAGRVTRLNAAAERLTGWTVADAVGRPLAEVFRILDATTRQPGADPVQQVLASGHVVGLANDTVLVARDGRELQIADSAAPILRADGSIAGVVLVFSDVTAQYRAQQALRDRERQLSAITDALPGPVSRVDREGRYLFANLAYERWFDRPRDQVVGRTQREVLGEYYTEVEPYVQQALAGKTVHYEIPVPAVGGDRHAMVDLVPDRADDGGVVGHYTIVTDITERKRAEDALRISERRTRGLLDTLGATIAAIPDLLFELTRDGRIERVHAGRPELLVAPPAEQLGRRVDELLPPDAAAVVMAAVEEAQHAGFSSGRQYRVELRDGTHWFEVSAALRPAPAGEEPRFVMLSRDVSDRQRAEAERRALEAQLRESQRLETIGALAGGIAHDFNNMIAGILGNAALARQELPQDHPALASLGQIERAGLRARAMVRRILDQGRRAPARFTDLPLQPVLEEPIALLRSTLPPGVRLEVALGDEPITVHGDATQLQQVVMNLCVNAVQALPPGGGRVDVTLEADARSVRVHVRDNGCGMDADTLAHAFDPLFTTKGEGTGLGLAVVKGIVQGHGGRIDVQSLRGAGTTFTVELPRAGADAAPADAAALETPAAPGAGEHVLYVDDDEIMREVVRRLLERAGWRISTAADASAALARLEQPAHGVQAVVTDMTMPPGMSGLELCRVIGRLHPGLPVLICSGHRTDELLAQSASAGVHTVVAKEDLLETLVPAVAAALSERGGS